MKTPFNGAVAYRLLIKRYAKQVLYRIKTDNNKSPYWKVVPCLLAECPYFGTIERPEVCDFDKSWRLSRNRAQCSWDNIFMTYEEAYKESKRRNGLYIGFDRIPYVGYDILENYKNDLLNIERSIKNELSDYDSFVGIDFTDVSAGGIQIRGHHKDVSGFTYGDQITINYDFSNKDEVVDDFVSMWKSCDTKAGVQQYNSFLEQGMRYGWN